MTKSAQKSSYRFIFNSITFFICLQKSTNPLILRGKFNLCKKIVLQKISDVGETSEGLSDEQNEEVTEPSEEDSEEGNSEDEGDDIANEDPADEDPIEEEPSEGDLEEVEEPAIGLMGEDDDPPADTDTFNVTLPTNPQGYTITDAAETATKDTDYTFKVTAKTGYKIKAVKYTISDTTADADPVA